MSHETEIIADEWVAARDEIRRLRTVNAALIRIVLDDKEGDLDFVKFQVRELLAKEKRDG